MKGPDQTSPRQDVFHRTVRVFASCSTPCQLFQGFTNQFLERQGSGTRLLTCFNASLASDATIAQIRQRRQRVVEAFVPPFEKLSVGRHERQDGASSICL